MSDDEEILQQSLPQPMTIEPQPQPLAQPQPQPMASVPQAPILPIPQQVQKVESVETRMATAETPVTGQARMDTAWGSSEGDEDISQMASISQTDTC